MMQYQTTNQHTQCAGGFGLRLAVIGVLCGGLCHRPLAAAPNGPGAFYGGATWHEIANEVAPDAPNDAPANVETDAGMDAQTDKTQETVPEPAPEAVNQGAARIMPFESRPRREVELRKLMVAFGVGDTPTQDAVLNHLGDEVRSRTLLRRRTAALLEALKRPDRSDAQVQVLLNEYRNAVESDKDRRREAEETLNDRIGFKDNPRLESVLVLFGAIGDTPVLLPSNSRPFVPRKNSSVNPNRRPNDRALPGNPPDEAARDNLQLATPDFGRAPFDESRRTSPAERREERRAQRAVPREEKLREGILLGTVMARRRDGIDVKADDGVIHRFTARLVVDAQGKSRLDRAIMQTFAQLNAGSRVRLKWAQTDRKRITLLERIDVDR